MFGIGIVVQRLSNLGVIVLEGRVFAAIVGIVAQSSDSLGHPNEPPARVHAHFCSNLLGGVTLLLHIENHGGAHERLIIDNARLGICLIAHHVFREAEQFAGDGVQHSLIVIIQVIDERMVEFVDENHRRAHPIFKCLACPWADIVAAHREHLFGLTGQLAACPIVATAIGEADDEAIQLVRIGAIERRVPVLMEVLHDVFVIPFQFPGIKRLVLFEELMETGVGIELVEFGDQSIDVNISPPAIHEFLITHKLEALSVNNEVHRQIHRSVVTDAVLLYQTLIIADRGMLAIGGEPSLGVLSVLATHVHVVLLSARSAREDTHQLYGFRYFGLHLGLHRHCDKGKRC